MSRIEEYDDGYDSRESFERVDEDREEDLYHDDDVYDDACDEDEPF